MRRSNSTASTLTVYDEVGNWLGEYDGVGNPSQQVVWLDGLPVGLFLGAVVANQPLHYIEADALGSPRAVIDAQRDVVVWDWPLVGEAFGNNAPNQDAEGDGTSLTFNLRSPGQQYDNVSRLNYNYFRDYDATTGRYVESDPIGLMAGINTFSYVGASPLVWSDPLGLLRWNELPAIWSPSYKPGMTPVSTIPSLDPSGYKPGVLARTNLSWQLSQTCSCRDGGFALDEYSVEFQLLVLVRKSYSSQWKRDFATKGEMNHVQDFQLWISSAKSMAQEIEDSQKARSFTSRLECEQAAATRMQSFLNDGAEGAFWLTKLWDASGLHSYNGR